MGGDRATDHEIVGPHPDGLRGGQDALLVIGSRPRGTDPGNHEDRSRSEVNAQRGDFLRAGDESADTRLQAESRESQHLGFNIRIRTAGAEGFCGGAGEHRDSKDQKPGAGCAFGGGTCHVGPTREMNGCHLDAEIAGGADRTPDGVRDVVKFEIQEDPVTGGGEFPDKGGPGSREELKPHFEKAHMARQEINPGPGGAGVGHIERQNDFVFRRGLHRMEG